MYRLILISLLTIVAATSAYAQGKGVDRQGERIRDAGNNRNPGNNGSKQDVGTGRGFDFGRGRTPETTALPNPLRITARNDAIMKTLEEIMQERKLILDTTVSNRDAGILVSQPFTFSRGAIVTDSELNRLAAISDDAAPNFTQGRYTLRLEVQRIDTVAANVSATARIEARGGSVTRAEWVSLPSSGALEQEILSELQT